MDGKKIAIGAGLAFLGLRLFQGRDSGYYRGLDDAPHLRTWFENVSYAKRVPIGLLVEICRRESGFNLQVTDGKAGEIGIMQVKPATAAQFGLTGEDMRDPAVAIQLAGTYLRWIADRVDSPGNWARVAMGYNGGPGYVFPGGFNGKGPSIAARAYAAAVVTLRDGDPHYYDNAG